MSELVPNEDQANEVLQTTYDLCMTVYNQRQDKGDDHLMVRDSWLGERLVDAVDAYVADHIDDLPDMPKAPWPESVTKAQRAYVAACTRQLVKEAVFGQTLQRAGQLVDELKGKTITAVATTEAPFVEAGGLQTVANPAMPYEVTGTLTHYDEPECRLWVNDGDREYIVHLWKYDAEDTKYPIKQFAAIQIH